MTLSSNFKNRWALSDSACKTVSDWRIKKFWKNSSLWQSDLVGVLLLQGSQNRNFTHPIFESDFDCLTGKNRLHANSLPSPIASDKNKNLQRKKKKCRIFYIFFSILKNKNLLRIKALDQRKKSSKKKTFFFNFNFLKNWYKTKVLYSIHRLASYRLEWTSSRPITEVKLGRARLVLTWVTGWEYLVR